MIRAGRDSDAAGCLSLIAACWGEYPGPFDVEAEIPDIHALASGFRDRGGALWVAEAAGLVVGMAGAYPAADAWHVSRMYVAANQRGSGLAGELLRRAESHARTAGAARMVLWSDLLFTRAHSFYEKHGYVRRGGVRALDNLSKTIEAGYAKPLAGLAVEQLDVAAAQSAEPALAAVLQRCVADGASVSFLPPLGRADAMAYWRTVTKAVGLGTVAAFGGWIDGALVGTVQLGLDTPPNQPHRGEIRKLLTDPAYRRRGLAARLMAAAEREAASRGRGLLTLDTKAGDGGERLYRATGWIEAGRIPRYALDGAGGVCDTVLFYKQQQPAV